MDTPGNQSARPGQDPVFSLARDDLWYRIQRFLHIVPANGKDGVVRRTIIFTLVAWLPLVLWAMATGHLFDSATGEPLMRHLSIHARFLIALPVLIYGERLDRSLMKRLLPRFIAMGIVPEEKVPAFRQVIHGIIHLRNSTFPWIGIGLMILLWIFIPQTGHRVPELSWAREQGTLGFGGWWYLFVSRPIFQIFLFGWLWRIVLLSILLKRIVGLGLQPVATHPDRLAGLGFIEGFPRLFTPLAFATSCLLASKWAHEIAWHGAHITAFKMQAGIFGALILLLCLGPLAVFIPFLKKTKRKAIADYGQLIARHGRLVHQQWIEGRPPADRALLEAPELGPACDIAELYEPVRSMRMFPFSKKSLAVVLIPAALPLLAVCSMEIPLLELLGDIFKTLL